MGTTLSGLYCYPVKSCRGISLQSAEVAQFGIRFDRQWMVVDQAATLVSQRGVAGMAIDVKTMCLIETAIEGESLTLRAPDMPDLSVPLTGREGDVVQTKLWMDVCTGMDQGDEPAQWFTRFLSRERPGEYRLIRTPDQAVRKTGALLWGAPKGDIALGFSNAHPFLVVSQPSLDDLNSRMPKPLPMDRFRPNIVMTGCDPYLEDHMAHIRIREVELRGATLCVRCPFTTADQRTGERGEEPLKTLATYRKGVVDIGNGAQRAGVVFGRDFDHIGSGSISVGDAVEVLAWD